MTSPLQPPPPSEAKTSAERVRLHRLREKGYALEPCPSGLHWRDKVPWAEGVWKRQAELMQELRP